MSWNAGEVMCKMCQMSKQFAMYISSAMVVVGIFIVDVVGWFIDF